VRINILTAVLLKMPVRRHVTLCHWVCVLTVPDVFKVLGRLTLKIKVLDTSECQELLIHWHSITSQKNWIFQK